MRSYSSEKGSAIVAALVLTAMSAVIIKSFMTLQSNLIQGVKLDAEAKKRTEIAKRLSGYIANPDYFTAQIGKNPMLRACTQLGGNDLDCIPMNPANSDGEYPFRLYVPEYHFFGDSSAGDRNCPVQDHISCLLAGTIGSESVGFNFQGDTGLFSPDFPLKSEVFFKPVCPTDSLAGLDPNPRNVACRLAKSFLIRYQLTHYQFHGNVAKIGRLGVLPINKNYYEMSIGSIIGNQCNPNATMVFYDSSVGRAVCICEPPYEQLPERNEKGVKCRIKEHCPSGLAATGTDSQGRLICVRPEDNFLASVTHKICVSSDLANCGENATTEINCSQNGKAGLVTELRMNCDKQQLIINPEVDDSAGWILVLVFGGSAAGIGVAMFLRYLAGILAQFAFAPWIPLLISLFFFLYFFFKGNDFTQYTQDGSVACEYSIRCSLFK